MAKYFLTNKAVEDLSQIWNYTCDTWSEKQATKYYNLIIETCQEIAERPHLGKIYNEISEKVLGLRVGKHIIFFQELRTQEIEVIRILHVRMDLKNKISE